MQRVTTVEQLYQRYIKPISVLEQLQLLALISQQLALGQLVKPKTSRADLKMFFQQCDGRELGTEPDWQEHLTVIQHSKNSGQLWN
jgi:hypothetical protein